VLYNYTAGILTVFITSILIWVNHRLALPAAGVTFGAHALVMLILLLAYRGVVAPDSLVAMTLRLLVWGIILVLLVVNLRRQKARTAPMILSAAGK
jgi:hypothetical protein